MTRYNSFITTIQPDFWRDKFKPKDIMKVFAHIQSVLSSRLDMKLLEAYDIQKIPEHTIGYTRTWVPIVLGGETYLGDDSEYPWMYAIVAGGQIDSDWLYIDAIYDKHVDPDYSYQYGIDYEYDDGLIRFRNKVPDDIEALYVSKGQYAGYRIKHEIGSLLRYERKDSKFYRDAIEPVMISFYKGPTYKHLLALLNIAFGMPVTKYGDEEVISVGDDKVVTNKYSYNIPTSVVTVTKGEILEQFQPLTNTISLVTNKSRPDWWKSKPADMFQKYILDRDYGDERHPGKLVRGHGITEEDKEWLLSNFLEDVLVYIEINLDSINYDAFNDSKDLLDLFYDALPTRTDPIISKVGRPSDSLDDIDPPDTQDLGVRIHIDNVYGTKNIYTPIGIYSPDLGRPTFLAENEEDAKAKGLTIQPLTFSINDHTWHIFDESEQDNFREFWKDRVNGTPLLIPPVERIYLRWGIEKPWDFDVKYKTSAMIDPPSTNMIRIEYGGRLIDIDANDIIGTGPNSSISNSINIQTPEVGTGFMSSIDAAVQLIGSTEEFSYTDVESVIHIHPDTLEDWDLDEGILIMPNGLTLKRSNRSSIATNASEPIFLGNIPKTIEIETSYTSDDNNGSFITFDWKTSGSKFTDAKESGDQVYNTSDKSVDKIVITGVAGYLTLRYTLYSNDTIRPTLKDVLIRILD